MKKTSLIILLTISFVLKSSNKKDIEFSGSSEIRFYGQNLLLDNDPAFVANNLKVLDVYAVVNSPCRMKRARKRTQLEFLHLSAKRFLGNNVYSDRAKRTRK